MSATEREYVSRTQIGLPGTVADEKIDQLVKFSVILVNYNGRDYIDKCLQSLISTLPPKSEIIVVDNASPDGSGNYIAEQYPHVTVLANRQNVGFGKGNNLGVDHAQGEYLVFLNPDTYFIDSWLEPMLTVLESSPKIGMVTPKILLLREPELINACGNEMHFTGLTLCRGARAKADQYNESAEVNAVSGAAFVVRKSLFQQLGGFDSLMFLYMEDTDLSLRVRQAGYTVVYTPKSVVYHDYSLSFGRYKTYYQERNRYIMLLKSLRWKTLFLLIPALLLAELVTWGFVLVKARNRPTNKLMAYWETLREWSTIRMHRREVQKKRKLSDHDLLKFMMFRMDFEQTGRDSVSTIAHLIFDPLFFIMHRMLLFIVRW